MYRQNTFNVLLIRGTVHFTRDLENNISVDLSNICGIFILTQQKMIHYLSDQLIHFTKH